MTYHYATHQETDTAEINSVMTTPTQNTPEQNECETLPDLVLNKNSVVNKVNTTEDEDEAAEALLQLSKYCLKMTLNYPWECYPLMLPLY